MGNEIYQTPPGSTLDSNSCDELCIDYERLQCSYWKYDKAEKQCTLYESKDNECSFLSGPELPSIESCIENYSTITPPATKTSISTSTSTTTTTATTTTTTTTTATTTSKTTTTTTTSTSTTTSTTSSHDDTLWPLEAANTRCEARTKVSETMDQLECQRECESSSNCVGIERSHQPSYDRHCIICFDDDFQTSANGFGFYRRPGFEYQGFLWYLGKEGASCDSTCKDLGMNNLAEAAAGVIEEDDCTLMNNFLDQGEMTKGEWTNCFTYGYFYTWSDLYYCVHYGDSNFCGVKPGYDNDDEGRRLICPCLQI